ncbi:MAG: hypothetical protein IKN71_05500 [Alphaproteobacteria bacterium]|nr:hypothetical protein [Alphaproteobacteria bacterium]
MSEENANTTDQVGTNAGENAGADPAFLFENTDASSYGEANVNFLKENNLSNMSDLVALATKGKNALELPKDNDQDSLLNFRKACGYPETADGYGFKAETEEEKGIADFVHKCQLDKWAAKAVYNQIIANIKAEDAEDKKQYDAEVAKIKSNWGENAQGNESLLQRGVKAIGLSEQQLQEISGIIGVEAALNLMLTLGRVKSDHAGITGGSGSGGEESLDSFIYSRRGM